MTAHPDPRPDPRAPFARLVLEADTFANIYAFGHQPRPSGRYLIGAATP